MPTARDAIRLIVTDPEALDAIKRRERARERRPRTSRVDISKSVHPAVWRAAMTLAGGDARRIHVVSPTDVVVR